MLSLYVMLVSAGAKFESACKVNVEVFEFKIYLPFSFKSSFPINLKTYSPDEVIAILNASPLY